jgi:hypothetical protein
VCAILMLALMIVSPGLFMLTWHLRYGNKIKTRGKAVYVPLGWIAEIGDGNQAELTKVPFFIPLNGMVFETISIGQSAVPQEKNIDEMYKSSETFFWKSHSDLGQFISGPIKMGSGSQEIFCMEGTDPKSAYTSAECLLLRGTWIANFMGNKKDLAEFFSIIQKLN